MLQLKDTDWLNGNKNKTHTHVVYNRPTSDLGTQVETEEMENYISCKWKSKESRSSNSYQIKQTLK